MVIKISLSEQGQPHAARGKLADAELHFGEGDGGGLLVGLKLMGFAVWEARQGGRRSVTFPARTYSVNGERRSYSLLRVSVQQGAEAPLRDAILKAYDAVADTKGGQ